MDRDRDCERAMDALRSVCGRGGDTGGGSSGSNTFYVEAKVAQGRTVTPEDVDEICERAEDAATTMGITLGLSPDEKVETRCVPGETIGGSSVSVHVFWKLPVSATRLTTIGGFDETIRQEFGQEVESSIAPAQDTDVLVGRELDYVRLVDEERVAETIPDFGLPPREDTEIL